MPRIVWQLFWGNDFLFSGLSQVMLADGHCDGLAGLGQMELMFESFCAEGGLFCVG